MVYVSITLTLTRRDPALPSFAHGLQFHRAAQCPYLTRTLSAPSGVTRVAGAKAYAAKLATSPAPTWRWTTKENSQMGTQLLKGRSLHFTTRICIYEV